MIWRRAVRAHLLQPGQDRGSIAFAMLAIVVSAALGGLLMPIIITQSHVTRTDTTRVHALHAAQSGIDVVLGEIRAATATANGVATGDPSALPCGPVTGNANGTGSAAYSAAIDYYAINPATTNARAMVCTAGYGPYDNSLNTRTPRFAVVTSTGTDGPAVNGATKGRTLKTTYVFQTNDSTLPGGQIKIFPSGTDTFCMDAQSSTPPTGTAVLVRACSTTNPPLAQQNFVYRADLTIQLVSSVTTANPNGMCLDTTPTTHSNNIPIVLTQCTNPDPTVPANTPANQQWSVDDNAHLRGATSKSNTDSYCITDVAQTDGQALTLTTCAGGTTDTAQTWVPGLTAGAGMAGPTNNQIVNYRYFATCIDITGQDPTSSYEILYTCKQNPNPANVAWNQKFTPALGPLSKTALPQTGTLTTNNGTPYCLQSPTATGQYAVVTTSCTPSANNTWTWYQTKDSTGKDLAYAQVYTITDSSGRCLSPGPSNDVLNGQYLKIIVATCDGDTDQKWNADPSVLASRLINTSEN
jgi:Ricin-type beta-trefoil lectin domain